MCCIARRTVASVHGVLRRGEKRPSKGEETVCDCAERSVMMKSSPGSPFVVVEAELLLELLIVALDAPAKLGQVHESLERRCVG
jgi:hypothetical protein